jgi:uncharacterized membrane protein HdeD (DUF308 family)
MTRLDDFLAPLDHGVWEVAVPKASVTEPLDAAWVKSAINVPSPGTIASYRKGQYHAHELELEWKVHIDAYDPENHPFMHLADDAPLVLMISDTFRALIADTRETIHEDPDKEVGEQRRTVALMIGAGIFLIVMGILIGSDPLVTFDAVLLNLARLAIMAGGLFTIGTAFRLRPFRFVSGGRLALGLGILATGVAFTLLPPDWLGGVVLLIIGLWALASAYISFRRILHFGRDVPGGFVKRLGMGVFSLALAVLLVFAPDIIIIFLVLVIGILLILIGILVIARALMLNERMRGASRHRPEPARQS